MKTAPTVGVLFRSMQGKAVRNGTIIALVIVVVQLATKTWLDIVVQQPITTGRTAAGTMPALVVATGFTLLFVIAWQRIPLDEWRRYKIALALLLITQFVITWK
jgi:hypothetical protein